MSCTIVINHNNTYEINNIYYISIIAFIISMNRTIGKITIMIMIIIYSTSLFSFVINNNVGFIIIVSLINTLIYIVILMKR